MQGIIEYNGPIPEENIRRIPFKEILDHHRKRYVFHTKVGDIILKRIGQLDLEALLLGISEKDKDFLASIERSHFLTAKAKMDCGLTPEELAEMESMGLKLYPHMAELSLACFVDPKIKDMEEFDALLTALTSEEQTKLYNMLAELIVARLDGEVSATQLVLAREFGVPLANDLTVENMSATQATAMADILNKEQEQIKRAMQK